MVRSMFTKEELEGFTSRKEVVKLASEKKINLKKHFANREYEIKLAKLQTQLVNLQQWVYKNKKRLAILFTTKFIVVSGN